MKQFPSLLCLLFAVPAVAQTIVDLPIPSGVTNLSGSTFASADCVTVGAQVGTGVIHTWSGLPGSPTYASITLPVPLTMQSPMVALDEARAAYNVPGGAVALVVGLPRNPQVILTSLVTSASPFTLFPVNASTIVRLLPPGVEILRHTNTTSTVTPLSTPEQIIVNPDATVGAVSEDTFVALSVGPDQVALTADDRLVRVDGLSQPSTSSFTVSTLARTATWAPQGIAVVPGSAAVIWRRTSFGNFDVEVMSFDGPVVNSTLLSITVPGPFGYNMNPDYPAGVGAVSRNGVVLQHQDDVGTGYVVLGRVSGVPTVINSWFDDPNSATGSVLLNDRDVAFLSFVPNDGFSYSRWTNGTLAFGNTQEPINFERINFVVPNSEVIAAFAHVYSSVTIGQLDATITIARQAAGTPPTTTFTAQNLLWVGVEPSAFAAPRVFAMGTGRVAGFLRPATGPATTPTMLRICSFPISGDHEDFGARYAQSAVDLSLLPKLPSLSNPVTIQVTAPSSTPTGGLLGIAVQRTRGVNIAPYDALLHLDLSQALPLLPLTFVGNAATVTIGGGLPPSLEGIPFYVQAAVADAGVIAMSDLGVVTYGP